MRNTKGKKIAFMGLLFALAMALSFLESMLPPLPSGMKLGLSNIVTMYTLFFMNKKSAYTIAVMKSLFVFLTRGAVGALMSLAGGLFSVTAMIIFMGMKKFDFSYFMLSIIGAIFHNIGQLVMAYFIISSKFVIYYLPVMVLSGAVMGSVTGITLKSILPALEKLGFIE